MRTCGHFFHDMASESMAVSSPREAVEFRRRHNADFKAVLGLLETIHTTHVGTQWWKAIFGREDLRQTCLGFARWMASEDEPSGREQAGAAEFQGMSRRINSLWHTASTQALAWLGMDLAVFVNAEHSRDHEAGIAVLCDSLTVSAALRKTLTMLTGLPVEPYEPAKNRRHSQRPRLVLILPLSPGENECATASAEQLNATGPKALLLAAPFKLSHCLCERALANDPAECSEGSDRGDT